MLNALESNRVQVPPELAGNGTKTTSPAGSLTTCENITVKLIFLQSVTISDYAVVTNAEHKILCWGCGLFCYTDPMDPGI